tara:strand:- start:1748 stop:3286 length:1539 start_codon:yes stop_codon:yes gene_type:complete
MGSVITNLPGLYDQTNAFGGKKPQLTYVQFVPGVVVSVVTANDSDKYEGDDGRIGSIRALPHIGGKTLKKKSMVGEEGRYYPLFRGMQETPVKGDPVLLATFGGRQYYLGPLNTEGSPNFNDDYFEYDEIRSGIEDDNIPTIHKTSPLFIEDDYKRLQKPLNNKLDNPLYEKPDDKEEDEFVSNAIHGDTIFEGRHGNSIRIGSRNINPYIYISNGRHQTNIIETSLDSTILSITHRGSIREHFNLDPKLDKDENPTTYGPNLDGEEENENPLYYNFKLSDDEAQKDNAERPDLKRHITKSYEHYLGRGGVSEKNTSFDVNDAIYNYKQEQMFASSGRITFNARSDSIFLSAFKHIHIGCGSSMTFSTSKNILVEAAESVITNTPLFHVNSSGAVFIDGRMTEDENGNKIPSISLGNPTEGDCMHKAVLGNGMLTALSMVVEIIQNLALSTAESIEGRKKVGASVSTMKQIVKACDDFLGNEGVEDEARQESYMYPKKLADLILSDSVEIKK